MRSTFSDLEIGHQEVSNVLAELPVAIGGRRGVIQAALSGRGCTSSDFPSSN